MKKLTDFLSYRKEDKLYRKYSKLLINKQLEGIIKKELNTKVWKDNFDIGYYKDNYAKGSTLSDFVTNVMKYIGTGDIKEGIKLYNQRLDSFTKYINTMYKDFSEGDIKRHTYYRMFYMNYIGFMFEELLTELLESEGFEVIQSKELDNKYKIDILLKHQDYEGAIGIQCKNQSYLKVKKSIKDNHTAQHNKAIEDGICNEVIFLLYGSDFNMFVNYGIPIKERKLVEFIKNKFKNGNKKILISLADR